MLTESAEFQISQYVDGTLSAADREAVESMLSSDPQARKVLADYRQLNRQLVASQSIPQLNWDRLANAISDSLEQPMQSSAIAIAGRIGFWSARMRVAAAVLLTVGSAALVARHYQHHTPLAPVPATPIEIAVSGPAAEPPAGPATVEVSVSPSATAMRNDPSHFAQINRPSKVAISPVAPPVKNDSH